MPARLRARLRRHLVLLVLVASVAACSGGDDGNGDEPGDATPTTAAGAATTGSSASGLTVGQALGIGPSEVHVRGFLVAEEGGPIRLCTTLVDGAPPECGGPFLDVANLDLAAVADVETAPGADGRPGVRFVRAEIALLGVVQQGVISVTRPPS